jgi:hypothetical protein
LADQQVDGVSSYQRNLGWNMLNCAKIILLHVRLPIFWNNVVEDVLGLVLSKMLIGSKWWELIKIIVEFDPWGVKLTDCSIT